MQKLQPLGPYLIGAVLAVLVYYFPDARPIACGGAAVAPFVFGGN